MRNLVFIIMAMFAFTANQLHAQHSSDSIKIVVVKFETDSIGDYWDHNILCKKIGVNKYDLGDKMTEVFISGFQKYGPEISVQLINYDDVMDVNNSSALMNLCNLYDCNYLVILNKMTFNWKGEPYNYYFNNIRYTTFSKEHFEKQEFEFVSTDILHISKIQKKLSKLNKQIVANFVKITPVEASSPLTLKQLTY